MNSPSGGPPSQGGKHSVRISIGLSLATIYDLHLARRRLHDIKDRLMTSMVVTGEDLLALEKVLDTVDSLVWTVQMVERNTHGRQARYTGPDGEDSA